MLAADRIQLKPVVPVLGNPEQARPNESLLVLRKNMFEWGVSHPCPGI